MTAVTAGAVTATAGSASAAIWTPIASGTDGQISAIEYQSDARFWYATTNGKLAFRNPDGTFGFGTGPGATVQFNDIAFQATGQEGVAVGNGNNVWHTNDGGHVWTKLTIPPTINNDDCSQDPAAGNSSFEIGFSVSYASESTVYVTGDRGNILKSIDGGDSFTEVNKKANDDDGTACRVDATVITDSFFFDAANGRFISRYFGGIFSTDTGLTSNATKLDEAVSNYTGIPRFTWDRSNPVRGWAVDRCLDCFYSTGDGGAVFQRWGIGGPEILPDGAPRPQALHDIAAAGGTIVTAGNAGQILTSSDGANFFYQGAGSPNATRDWRAVDLASATKAAVGGANGALVVTSQANVTPDIVKPTGTISGPASAVVGQAVTFTLNATDTGGSGLNPASYAWTAAGLAGKSGNPVSFTFPAPGSYTVKVTFADNAGNTEDAIAFISVSAPAAPSFSFSGAGNSATAKIIGNRVRVRIRGTVRPPAGVSVSAACNGKVRLTIKKKSKTLLKTQARLKLKSGRCRFGKTVYIKRSRVGRATKLRLKVRFPGNAVLKAGSTTKTLVVRK